MNERKRHLINGKRWGLNVAVVWLLIGCTLAAQTPIPATPVGITPVPATPTTAPQPRSEDGWQRLAPGLERRVLIPDGNLFAQIVALRIDPQWFTFRVHYRPGQPLRLSEWQAELPEAVAFVNVNFFSPAYEIEGLLVADGVVYGRAFQERGGMFGMVDGMPFVRSNQAQPYQGERLDQAVQAFPMLVENGVQAYTSTRPDRFTRRTAVAQDNHGRILLFATPLTGLTLVELSAFLASGELELSQAFNLDGGGSTLLLSTYDAFAIPSVDPVPAVLAVYPR